MSKILFLMAFLLVGQLSSAQDSPEFERHQFQTTGDALSYRLLRPKELVEGQTYPLVVFLHGSGERGNDNTINLKYITPLFLTDSNRINFPCYVLVPQCPANEEWTAPDWYQKPGEPISTVVALIDSLSSLNTIDKTRIYLTGLSMGGYGTWYLITQYPDKFAAAVPICGGGDWHQAEAIKHVPIWAFHGAKDDVVPRDQSRRMIEALKNTGGEPKYTEYKKTGHDSWTKAYQEPNLLPWMFRQRLVR
jgi:predicted peptidase